MSQIFHERTVAKSRKPHICTWCGEAIEVGQAYQSYRWRDWHGSGTEIMHPECYAAMQGMDPNDAETWMHGDFERGCLCSKGDCKCEATP